MSSNESDKTKEIFNTIKAEIKVLAKDLQTDITRDRGMKNRNIWHLQKALGHMPEYFSDAGQDMVLDRYVFKGKREGTFVELGGYDGLQGSSCLFFELMRRWDGLLVEGNPGSAKLAREFRRCKTVDAVVSGTVRETSFLQVEPGAAYSQMGGVVSALPKVTTDAMAANKVPGVAVTVTTETLADILRANGITHIDYLAIDIVGSEMDVLSTFPFDEFSVTAMSVENLNKDDTSITELLQDRGFILLDYLGLDEVYVDANITIEA